MLKPISGDTRKPTGNRTFLKVLLAAVTMLATGCGETFVVATPLVGSWVDSVGRRYSFDEDGSFVLRVDYEGNSSKAANGFFEILGSFSIDGMALTVRPEWSRSRRPSSDEVVFGEVSYRLLENCIFEVNGDDLILTYLTYPAESAVETTSFLTRIR